MLALAFQAIVLRTSCSARLRPEELEIRLLRRHRPRGGHKPRQPVERLRPRLLPRNATRRRELGAVRAAAPVALSALRRPRQRALRPALLAAAVRTNFPIT